ncbi:leucine-rich repeat (LRR) family protein, partial [Striga asiatica]
RPLRHDPIVAGKNPILILPREICALESQRGRQYPLHIICHVVRAPPCRARGLCRQLVEKRHLIRGPRVHKKEYRVHSLPPACRGRMKEPDPVVHGHRHYPVRELRKEGTEPEEERLPTRGPLRADNEVPVVQLALDPAGIDLAGPEDLGEAGDGVGDGGDAAAEDGREDDGVHESAVGAHVEDTATEAEGRWGPADGDAGPEERGNGTGGAHGEEEAEGDADESEEGAEGDPEEDEEGGRGGWTEGEAAVVEDHGAGPAGCGGAEPSLPSPKQGSSSSHSLATPLPIEPKSSLTKPVANPNRFVESSLPTTLSARKCSFANISTITLGIRVTTICLSYELKTPHASISTSSMKNLGKTARATASISDRGNPAVATKMASLSPLSSRPNASRSRIMGHRPKSKANRMSPEASNAMSIK